ncbi:3-ketoacyl-coa synthase [Anaeramoeba flamelloides]|uniref:3-ketoacyl-coa synthase n=1 Tax=Anaeramoeba flamelloides TaxID=1746091 RepID=A0AAV7Z5Z6_9EUKA|nr:3-ketoacyl-coa synthase [Anaeramoeba flamelloides]
MDYTIWKPTKEYIYSNEEFLSATKKITTSTEETIQFQLKVSKRTETSDLNNLPKWLKQSTNIDEQQTYQNALEEIDDVYTQCLDDLFQRTGIQPNEIDLIVCNCSMFCPTPSISSRIINDYKMKENIVSYNFGGMGCAGGSIGVNLANDYLQLYPNKFCLIFCTETITTNWYTGKKKSMALGNLLFRVGGSALLLTNNQKYHSRSKFKFVVSWKNHFGNQDKAFHAVKKDQDENGIIGINLSSQIPTIVEGLVKDHVNSFPIKKLPIFLRIKYLIINFTRKTEKIDYLKKIINHYCPHAGGKTIVNLTQNLLNINDYQMEPSRSVWYNFRNVSASSVMYALAFVEGRGDLRKNDNIWILSEGSGFKICSIIWKSLINAKKNNKKTK